MKLKHILNKIKMNIYTSINYNLNNNIPYTSRNKEIKEIDKVCRVVINEFPVLSNSKFNSTISVSKSPRVKNYVDYLSNLIYKTRIHAYIGRTPQDKLFREIANMKNYKAGNCGELSDAAYVALKLNGYEDVKILDLFAYNKKTKSMRPIDHTVVGVNFKESENGGYDFVHTYNNKYLMAQDRYKYRTYPDNKSVIVDPWMGFVDYGKASSEKFKANKALKVDLDADEELCYIAHKDVFNLEDKDMEYFKNEYPNLIKNKKVTSVSDTSAYSVKTMSAKIVDELREAFNLKKLVQMR